MSPALDQLIRQRAGNRCEYCHTRQAWHRLRLQMDHIIAQQHGGTDELENLALACGQCNRFKGPNLSGVDPETGSVVRLFHPRLQTWEEHFHFNIARIIGRTPVGRATVHTLQMNNDEELRFREDLLARGIILDG